MVHRRGTECWGLLLLGLALALGCAGCLGRTSEAGPRTAAPRARSTSPWGIPNPNPAWHHDRRVQAAFLDNRCGEVLRLDKRIAKAAPGWRYRSLVGICACRLKRRQLAQRVYRDLHGPTRRVLFDACGSLGVTLHPAPIPRAGERLPPRPRDRLFTQARAAWFSGRCALAIWLAKRAEARQPTSRNAQVIGACACTLGRRAEALRAYGRLRGGVRHMLMQLCRVRGIDLRSLAQRVITGRKARRRSRVRGAATPAYTADELYGKARSAWLAGQCGRAIRYAQRANLQAQSSRHWSIIGACACTLRRVALAQQTLAYLRGGNRVMIVHVCRSKGIDLR